MKFDKVKIDWKVSVKNIKNQSYFQKQIIITFGEKVVTHEIKQFKLKGQRFTVDCPL